MHSLIDTPLSVHISFNCIQKACSKDILVRCPDMYIERLVIELLECARFSVMLITLKLPSIIGKFEQINLSICINEPRF
jgi:hypothetical protein